MASESLTFFDIPSKDQGCACWSVNTWKTRAALNFKGIEYRTAWTEYPDIQPTLESLGVKPQRGGGASFICPAVRFPDGVAMQDSIVIAQELERRCPSPSLHLDEPVVQRVCALVEGLLQDIGPMMMVSVTENVLSDSSADFFIRGRERDFGMPMAKAQATYGGEDAWIRAWEKFDELEALLAEIKDQGPFFMGATPSYADLVLAGQLQFFRRGLDDTVVQKRIGERYQRVMGLYAACAKWLERDGR